MRFDIEEKVFCRGSGDDIHKIRVLVCECQRSNSMDKLNPILDRIIQAAFDAGRDFEKDRNGDKK